MKTSLLILAMTALTATGAQAQDAVPPVVTKAINGIATQNLPPNGHGNCTAKAASAPGVGSPSSQLIRGTDKNSCDDYINDSGAVGDKGRVVEEILTGSHPHYQGYRDLLMSNKSLFDDENANGGVSICPAFGKEMSQGDRAKVYIKLLAEIARGRSGCQVRPESEDKKEGAAGEFRLPFERKARMGYGQTFAGSQKHCSSNVSVGGPESGVKCALDMLAEQLKLKTKEEASKETSGKEREVGILSKQSLFDELNPDKNDKGEAKKRWEAIQKAFENFGPCKSK